MNSAKKKRKSRDFLLECVCISLKPVVHLISCDGALAQLARASHWQCEGQRFKSAMLHHFLDSPPTGPPVGFFVFGADFEVELAHLQCRRESSVFAFPSVFPMISRQILRRVEVVGFSIGEAKVGETHKKSDLLIFGIEKRDSPLVGKYVVIYSLSSH